MTNKKSDPPMRVKKAIIQESGGVCAFCGEKDVSTLEFHHIDGRDHPDPHNSQNLIYVCSNCHSKIDAGIIPKEDVKNKKRSLANMHKYKARTAQFSQAVNFTNSVNTGNITNIVNYKVTRKKPKLPSAEGAIATDLIKRYYIKHLIDRYNEFAKNDGTKTNFSYGFIYTAIKREFGAKWDMIPLTRFLDLCDYLQRRIDRTILGRVRKSGMQNNYSSYDEYLSKYVAIE